jgi:hypothetical protein
VLSADYLPCAFKLPSFSLPLSALSLFLCLRLQMDLQLCIVCEKSPLGPYQMAPTSTVVRLTVSM